MLRLRVAEGNLIIVEKTTGILNLVLTYLSLIFITGIAGVGSCIYVVISFMFGFKTEASRADTDLLYALLSQAGILGGVFQMAGIITMLHFPECIVAFNELTKLEKNCEFCPQNKL